MLEALEKSLCVVTTACKTVGIDRQTHYNWMNKDLKYKKAVEDLQKYHTRLCGITTPQTNQRRQHNRNHFSIEN